MRVLIRAILLFVLFFAVYFSVERLIVYPLDPRMVEPADIGLPQIASHRFETSDGSSLIYWTAAAATNKPTVLYLHGNAGNLNNRKLRFERLLARGYGIVAPAYRGSSGSEGWPTERAISRDISEFYTALITGKLASRQTIPVIYGESIGAAVALRLVAELSETTPPRAVILEAPFTNIKDVAKAMNPALILTTGLMRNRWESLSYAPRVKVPVLILHGRQDPLVPITQGRRIFEALGSDDKTLFEVPDAEHINVWKASAQRKLYGFLSRFDQR